jgi:hypothetical protein
VDALICATRKVIALLAMCNCTAKPTMPRLLIGMKKMGKITKKRWNP